MEAPFVKISRSFLRPLMLGQLRYISRGLEVLVKLKSSRRAFALIHKSLLEILKAAVSVWPFTFARKRCSTDEMFRYSK